MTEEASAGAKRAGDQAQRFHEVFESVRQRTDYTSKGLGAIGVAAVAGVGYANLANDFPYGGPWWAVPALLLGVLAMIGAVMVLVGRFNRANESIITSPSYEETFHHNNIKDNEEKDLIKKIYGETAKQQQVATLRAYEARGQRFERIASQCEGPRAELLRARADQILTEVTATEDRAAALLLRHRGHLALFNWIFAFWIFVFAIGWYATALASDALQSDRSDRIEVAKLCAEARAEKEIVESDLPSICGDPPEKKEVNKDKAPATKVAGDGLAALATAYENCLNAAEENGEDRDVCVGLEDALGIDPLKQSLSPSGSGWRWIEAEPLSMRPLHTHPLERWSLRSGL